MLTGKCKRRSSNSRSTELDLEKVSLLGVWEEVRPPRGESWCDPSWDAIVERADCRICFFVRRVNTEIRVLGC